MILRQEDKKDDEKKAEDGHEAEVGPIEQVLNSEPKFDTSFQFHQISIRCQWQSCASWLSELEQKDPNEWL